LPRKPKAYTSHRARTFPTRGPCRFVRIGGPAGGTGENIDENAEFEQARCAEFVRSVPTSLRAAAASRNNLGEQSSFEPHPEQDPRGEQHRIAAQVRSVRPTSGAPFPTRGPLRFCRIAVPAGGTGGNIDQNAESEPARGVRFVRLVPTSLRAAAASRNSLGEQSSCEPHRFAGVAFFVIDESCAPLAVAWILCYYPSHFRFRVLGVDSHESRPRTTAPCALDAGYTLKTSTSRQYFPRTMLGSSALGVTGDTFVSAGRSASGGQGYAPCTAPRDLSLGTLLLPRFGRTFFSPETYRRIQAATTAAQNPGQSERCSGTARRSNL